MASWLDPRRWGLVEWFIACCALVFVYSLTPWAVGSGVASLQRWVFRPGGYVWQERPWTALSYALIHADLPHLILNLLALGYLSRRVGHIGSRRLAILLLSSILLGAVFYSLGDVIFSALGIYYNAWSLLGSSAAIFGLCILNVLYAPRAFVAKTPWGVLRLWHLALGIFLISLLGWGNVGGLLAHLGGAFAGWLCYWLWLGRESSLGTGEANEDRRKRLIDKARRSGIHSLSREERKWLLRDGKPSAIGKPSSRSHSDY